MGKSIQIKNNLRQLSLLNDFIGQAKEELHLSPSIFMNLKLAVEEAVVNCILYAYPNETDKDILVQLNCEEGKLTVIITDYGIAFDPTSNEDPDINLPLEQRPIGGCGTYLTKRLMSNVSYLREDGKNILLLTKELH